MIFEAALVVLLSFRRDLLCNLNVKPYTNMVEFVEAYSEHPEFDYIGEMEQRKLFHFANFMYARASPMILFGPVLARFSISSLTFALFCCCSGVTVWCCCPPRATGRICSTWSLECAKERILSTFAGVANESKLLEERWSIKRKEVRLLGLPKHFNTSAVY